MGFEKIDQPDLSAEAVGEEEIDSSESVESMEIEEGELKAEIAEGVNELNDNLEELESIIESDDFPQSLKDRIGETIWTISKNVNESFVNHVGVSVSGALMLGVHQIAINEGVSVIQDGSFVGGANMVAIAGAALYACAKSIQFVGRKFDAFNAKRALESGTKGDTYEIEKFISNSEEQGMIDEEDIQISSGERIGMLDEYISADSRKTAGELSKVLAT